MEKVSVNTDFYNLGNATHILIAGTTGSGKSVFIHEFMHANLLVRNSIFILIDPKQIELKRYEDCINVSTYSPLINASKICTAVARCFGVS